MKKVAPIALLVMVVISCFVQLANSQAPQGTQNAKQQAAEQQAFSSASQAGTAAAWESFLKQYPRSRRLPEARVALDAALYGDALLVRTDPDALGAIIRRCKTAEGADKVFSLLDDASYQQARDLNSEDALRKYLARLPKGSHETEVRSTLESLLWEKCGKDDLKACRAYSKDYPYGRNAKEVRAKIDELDFLAVKAQDSIEAYESFLGNHYNHSAATARLSELLYDRASASGALEDWIKFEDRYRAYPSASLAARIKQATEEIERLTYESIVATPTLKICETYLSRFPNGKHVPQVKVLMEPLLFDFVKSANTVEAYRRYIQTYPKGNFEERVLSLLDPVLFAWALKEDWHSAYAEYLRLCPICTKKEKAEERLAWLKANPAAPTFDYPSVVRASSGRWEWTLVFKEGGGKIGFRVRGSGSIVTKTGARYGPTGGGFINRGEIVVKPGGSSKDSYWLSSADGTICDGDAVFTWSGEDAGGRKISLQEKVHLTCT